MTSLIMGTQIHLNVQKIKVENRLSFITTRQSLGHHSKFSMLNLIVHYGERSPLTRYEANWGFPLLKMKILFIHEVGWFNKVIYEMHDFPELLSLKGHEVHFKDTTYIF